MEIQNVGKNIQAFKEPVKESPQEQVPQEAKKENDKLEISEEAKKLGADTKQVERFQEIQTRIKSGYYNSEEVLNSVTNSITRVLNEDMYS